MRAGLARRPPPGARARLPLLVAAAVLALDPLVAVFALPEIMAGLGVVPEDLDRGVLLPATFVGTAALAAWTCLRRPLPVRPALIAALAGHSGASLLTASADSLAAFLLPRAFAGAAAGVALVALARLLDDASGTSNRLAPVLWGAFAVSPLAVNAVLSVWSWRGTYVLWAIVSGGCAVVLLRRSGAVTRAAARSAPSVTLPAAISGAASALCAAALATVTVYVPLFARVTRDPESVGGAATVTWRAVLAFVVAALAVGRLLPRVPARSLAALGCLTAAGGLCAMSFWNDGALRGIGCWFALVATGAGLGAAVGPLVARGADADRRRPERTLPVWLAGAAVGVWVVSRAGEVRFNDLLGRILPPSDMCPRSPGQCAPYERAVRDAVLEQFQTVFASAALCAALAAVLVAFFLTPSRQRPGTVSA